MTQKEKDLLLKDLCARLPYGVKVDCNKEVCTIDTIDVDADLLLKNENGEIVPKLEDALFIQIEKCKPYLLPLSSMTKEQKIEYNVLWENTFIHRIDGYLNKLYEFYKENHLDNNGLIEKGLAIDTTNLNIY